MEIVDIGARNFSQVMVIDDPGDCGASHEYRICSVVDWFDKFGYVYFQKGPVKESGVNGCHQEDLLAIVIHRLQGFQTGPFKCRENALALTKLEEALHWLNHRTARRVSRGVEGMNVV